MRLTSLYLSLLLTVSIESSFLRKEDGRKAFSLEDILNTRPNSFRANWVSDHEIEFRNDGSNDVMVLDVIRNETRPLLDASVLKKYNSSSYKFSPDLKYVLLRYQEKQTFRHSTDAKYVVYSMEEDVYRDVAKQSYLQHASWTKVGSSIIYIKDNDIYYVSDMRNDVSGLPLSHGGIPGVIFNGISDWMYEEEILGKSTTYEISENGESVIYYHLDDREVQETKFMNYGEPGCLENQYTTEVTIRYPKSGTNIPKYKLLYYDRKTNETKVIAEYKKRKEVLYSFSWVNNDEIALLFTNRVQNESVIEVCHLKQGTCKKVYEDSNPRGWADSQFPIFSLNGDRFVTKVRQKFGSKEYIHINVIFANGDRVKLTDGNFMVTSIVAWDRSSGYVYYKASEPDLPSTEHFYAVHASGNEKPHCLTCNLVNPENAPCKFGSVVFNSEFTHFIGVCLGPMPSSVAVYENKFPVPQLVRRMDENQRMRRLLKQRLLPKEINLKVKVTNTIEADVRLLLPPKMDTSGKTKYPLLIYVYGGPDAHQIKDSFVFDWSLYLTTNRSIVHGIIDGRGSGRKGTEMMYAVYRALGTVEIQDQITGARYVRDNLYFIDKNRIGIWGWSYGGYATAKVLEEDRDGVFKCGVSVAPVSDWIYYNAGYTERYMDTPKANEEGYHRASLLYNVTNLRSKQFLLMHGTGDDNVHYQHAMHFAKVLERENILFQQQDYPDEAHGIANTKYHVYYTMDRFWEDCFGLSH